MPRLATMTSANVFIDDFNRADGNLGSNYDTATGFNSLAVSSNTVRASGLNVLSLNCIKSSVKTFSANQEAQVTYTAFNPTYFDSAGPAVRVTPENGTAYVLHIDRLDDSARRLCRVTGSVRTTIGTINLPAVAGDIFKLTASGSRLLVYKNGIQIDSVTDTTYPTGQPGLYYNRGNSNTTRMDDFIAADISTTVAKSLCIISQTPIGKLIEGSQ
jgi:hypothetical protein